MLKLNGGGRKDRGWFEIRVHATVVILQIDAHVHNYKVEGSALSSRSKP